MILTAFQVTAFRMRAISAKLFFSHRTFDNFRSVSFAIPAGGRRRCHGALSSIFVNSGLYGGSSVILALIIGNHWLPCFFAAIR